MYTPVNGLEINGNFVTAGIYTPVNGLEINGDFSGDTPPSTVYRRALLMDNGHIRQIQDSEIGTSKKPLVLYSSVFRVRSGSEGIPVIVLNGSFRTLASTETLLI